MQAMDILAQTGAKEQLWALEHSYPIILNNDTKSSRNSTDLIK